jgi:adenylosuccinate lyase
MSPFAINALSPLDGRYAAKLEDLRPLMSEQGYMHRRVQVEVAWFLALSDAGLAQFPPLSAAARARLQALVARPMRWPSKRSRRPPTTM